MSLQVSVYLKVNNISVIRIDSLCLRNTESLHIFHFMKNVIMEIIQIVNFYNDKWRHRLDSTELKEKLIWFPFTNHTLKAKGIKIKRPS